MWKNIHMSARTSGFPAVHSIVMRESVLFTLPVCVFKEMVDCCILLYNKATFTMIIDYQLFRRPVQYWLCLLQYNEVPLSLCNSRVVLQVNHQPWFITWTPFSCGVCAFFRGFRGWAGARLWWRSTWPSSVTWSQHRLSTCVPASRWWSPTSLPVGSPDRLYFFFFFTVYKLQYGIHDVTVLSKL